MGKKLIITCALCGSGTTRAQSPYVPITPEEIAADAVEAVKAGAAVLHIHVRDENGKNTMEIPRFVEVVTKVRTALKEAGLDAVLNLTTSGTPFTIEQRTEHLRELLPEMCSYDPGTMNWGNKSIFLNTPEFLERLGTLTQELGVKPECEIFDGGMMGNVAYYVKKGFLKEPVHYQMVLGAAGGMPGDLASINYLLSKMPEGSTWSITGIGRSFMPCMLAALASGCDGLRVGLEDNVMLDKGVYATNAQLVERACALGRLANREIATAQEAREILGLIKHV